VQVLSGSCSASFDKKRFPRRASASGQQVVLLTIDTACQGLHGAQGAADCLASGDLIGRFHLNIIGTPCAKDQSSPYPYQECMSRISATFILPLAGAD
jgi:hypothetical protein